MKPVKVLHLISGLGVGGAETMLVKLLQSMDREQFPAAVVSLGELGENGRFIESLGFRVYSLGLRTSLPSVFDYIALRRLIRFERPRLIQGWMYHGNVAATLSAAMTSPKIPVLWNVRQSLDDWAFMKASTRVVIRIGSPLSRLAAGVLYNSLRGAQQHEAIGYERAKSLTIPNGFDCDRFRPDLAARLLFRDGLGLNEDHVLIGQVGRLHPSKDHPTFLRAAREVVQACPDAHFLLVGTGLDGASQFITQMIMDLGLHGRVHLLGESAAPERIFQALDIATLSSLSEGFPNVVGEAMACGTPCIVTDVGDSAHIVGNPDLVVPPGDPRALASACNRMIAIGSEKRSEIGLVARQRIVSCFSMQAVGQSYADVYMDAVASAHGFEA